MTGQRREDGPGAARAATVQRLFREGLDLQRAGRMAEAETRYLQVLSLEPGHYPALHLAGVIAAMAGRRDQAVERLVRSLRLNSGAAAVHNDLGLVLNDLERHADAVASFDAALALKPDFATAHFNRGIALMSLRRPLEAVASYDRALAVRPDMAEAWTNRGNALRAAGRLEDAVASHDRALVLAPDLAEARVNRCIALAERCIERGNAWRSAGRFDQALADYDQAIGLTPDDPVAHASRGNALQDLKHHDAAIASYDRAIGLRPDFADAFNNRGNARRAAGHLDAALADFDRALRLKPDFAEAHANRANALRDLGRLEAAIAGYDRAAALKPAYADALWNKSLVLLTQGNFTAGWRLYELRKLTAGAPGKRDFDRPEWTGAEDIAGKTVFLHWEQGFGDTLMFSRYAGPVRAKGARVVMAVQTPLVRLLTQLQPEITVVGAAEVPAAFDYHIPLLSLPRALGTTLATIPPMESLLRPAPALAATWLARLPATPRRRIGVAWSGNPAHANDHNRSISLAALRPLLSVEADWVALQTEFRPGDRALLDELGIIVPEPIATDFADTAALIDALDLVITVDTSVAHLAGALGKPVWILLPFMPDFRWLLAREDSPWHPTARLFRQPSPGAWAPVVERVRGELQGSRSADGR